jgi:hypothetical protein
MKFAQSGKHPAAWAKGGTVLCHRPSGFFRSPRGWNFSPAFDIEHTDCGGGCNTAFRMNKAESERIHQLCSRIVAEQDQQEFLKLCEELNRMLSTKHERLQSGKTGSQEGD